MTYIRKDHFYRKAKQEGYRSRAAYKLLELEQKLGLLRHGMRVLDLGCSPGGWLQVAASLVGKSGRVVGVDLLPLEPLALPNLSFIQGDVTEASIQERIVVEVFGKLDLVLSDMAPNTSGVGFRDHALSVALVETAWKLSRLLLKPGGGLLVKVFDGPDLNPLVNEVKKDFETIKRVRLSSSRKNSRELYLVARGARFKAHTEAQTEG